MPKNVRRWVAAVALGVTLPLVPATASAAVAPVAQYAGQAAPADTADPNPPGDNDSDNSGLWGLVGLFGLLGLLGLARRTPRHPRERGRDEDALASYPSANQPPVARSGLPPETPRNSPAGYPNATADGRHAPRAEQPRTRPPQHQAPPATYQGEQTGTYAEGYAPVEQPAAAPERTAYARHEPQPGYAQQVPRTSQPHEQGQPYPAGQSGEPAWEDQQPAERVHNYLPPDQVSADDYPPPEQTAPPTGAAPEGRRRRF